MENEDNKIKLLVDDDAVFLKSLEIEFLHHIDLLLKHTLTGELCIANLGKKDVIFSIII
jgi:hypothetical protein